MDWLARRYPKRPGIFLLFLIAIGVLAPSGCGLLHRGKDRAVKDSARRAQVIELPAAPPAASQPSDPPRGSGGMGAAPAGDAAAADLPVMPAAAIERREPRADGIVLATATAPPEFDRGPLGGTSGRRELVRPAGGTVVHVNQADFKREVLESDAPVLVDFYATWCGPCRALAPRLDQVAAENPQAKIAKVDIDQNPQLAARYGVSSVPSVLLFKGGQVAAKQKGAVSKERLTAMLE